MKKGREVFNELFEDVFVPMMKIQRQSFLDGIETQKEKEETKSKGTTK